MTPKLLDKYSGCMLGGAVGDALGAPLEFLNLPLIRQRYGSNGLDHYIQGEGSSGVFTDDTQMTLFTAEGVLRAFHRCMLMGISGAEGAIMYQSYLRWLHTQGRKPARIPEGWGVYDVDSSWLINNRGLFARRAPGAKCVSALESGNCGTVREPINNSKGCGGIMRAAPFGIFHYQDSQMAFELACEAAAITHRHPSGYLSAGCLAAILACIFQGQNLPSAVETAKKILRTWDQHIECLGAIQKAQDLFASVTPSAENIEKLGGAWVGEETLAISIFCALHFQNDFRSGVLAAVNHSGDSDRTGAVTGNILGALLGKSAIPST